MDKRILTRQQTKARHQTKTCKVVEVKVDKSTLTERTLKHLNSLFKEARHFYNYCLSQENVNSVDTKLLVVPVKVLDHFEDRKLNVLSSQMKQSLKTKIFSSICTLHTLKSKGNKVGKLRFVSELNSIPLKQFGITYRIERERSRVRIQGVKQKLRVSGLDQIPENTEIANAHLIKKCGDFYLHITTYRNKVKVEVPDVSVGIDFGCQTQLTLSNGIKIEYEVPVSERLKRLDSKIQQNGRSKSKNKYKDQLKREKEYQHLTNVKRDIQKKIVSAITKNVKRVCFQDENIHAWHSGNHGKKIQNTGIGGIIRDLKVKSHTPIVVDKFFPSTQICPQCGHKQKLTLDQRIYKCEACGYEKDRDWKSSICIEKEGLKNSKVPMSSEAASKYKVPTERREVKLEETEASARRIFDSLKGIKGLRVSFCR